MSLTIKHQGQYRLMQSPQDQQKWLVLDNNAYEWLETINGLYLALGEANEARSAELLKQGDYLILCGRHESPWENDVDYLALRQDDDMYNALKLPYGLPTDVLQQKKVLNNNLTISHDKLRGMGLPV